MFSGGMKRDHWHEMGQYETPFVKNADHGLRSHILKQSVTFLLPPSIKGLNKYVKYIFTTTIDFLINPF